MKQTIIAGARGSGRTTWCVRWVMGKPSERAMLVRTEQDRKNIINHFRGDYPTLALRRAIYTHEDIRQGRHRGYRRNFAIDDYDRGLPTEVMDNIYAATNNELVKAITMNITTDEVIVLGPLKKVLKKAQ